MTFFVLIFIYSLFLPFLPIKRYLICVNTHMKELKPFGDVPKKLSVQVKRSFVATRTFTQALNVGRDVIAKMQSVITNKHKTMGIRISPSFSFLIEMIRLTTSTYTPRIKLVKPEI